MLNSVNFNGLNGYRGTTGYIPARKQQAQKQPQFSFAQTYNSTASEDAAKAQSNASKVRLTQDCLINIGKLNTQAAINAYSNL